MRGVREEDDAEPDAEDGGRERGVRGEAGIERHDGFPCELPPTYPLRGCSGRPHRCRLEAFAPQST